FAGTNVTIADALKQTNRYVFDAALRLTSTTNANQEVTILAYNPASQLIQLRDGKDQLTTWNYDIYGRPTNKFDGLARQVFRLSYDPGGRATNRWTPAKGNIGYVYDALGNVKSVSYSNAPAGNLSFGYDAVNQLTNMADAVGTTRFTYTAGGLLDGEDGPWA